MRFASLSLLTLLWATPSLAQVTESGGAGWVRLDKDQLYKVYGLEIAKPLTEPVGGLEPQPQQLQMPLVSTDGALIYAGTEEGKLYAVWLMSGKVLFKKSDLGSIGRAMAQYHDTLLVGSRLDLLGLEGYNGNEKWRLDLGGEIGGEITMQGKMAIIPIRPNSFAAIDADKGQQIWRVKHPTPDKITVRGQAPATIDMKRRTAYLGFSDGELVAVDLDKGTPKWSVPVGSHDDVFPDVDAKPILIEGGKSILAMSYSGGIALLKSENGAVIYKDADQTRLTGATNVDQVEWVVASHADGQVLGLDPLSGKVRWRYKLKKGTPTPPKDLGQGRVAVGCSDGPLVILDARNGKPIQLLNSGSGLNAPPSVRGMDMAMLSQKGWLLALKYGEGTGIVEKH